MAVIDASNLVLGRLASNAAERALKGEKIDIVNAEKTIIIGHKINVINKFKRKLGIGIKGNPEKGPKHSKTPYRILRRTIRGMLPYKRERGKKALKRVRVYLGVPKKFKEKKPETIKTAAYNGKEEALSLGEISESLGWSGQNE